MTFLATIPIFSELEDALHWTLYRLHDTGLPWAWTIVVLTCIVRIAILPLTARQTRSMLNMQRLQPYLKQLQERHKNDRAELNKKVMEFYQDNKVNPLASCFPLLIQIPVFIALFQVLRKFARSKPDGDLSFLFNFVSDITTNINHGGAPGMILLVIYVGSQMLSTYVMATSPDPRQRNMMLFLPIVFIPFVWRFPIGLMLYWITTNLWTLFQYLVVVRVTDVSGEVVLPEDSRGNKRVVVPKGEKAAQRAKAATGGKDATRPTSNTSVPATAGTPRSRKNKRRR